MTTKLVDEYADIKANMDKIRAERMAAIAGEPAAADVPAPELSYDAMYLHGVGDNAVNYFYGTPIKSNG